jgi:hypothetical protein
VVLQLTWIILEGNQILTGFKGCVGFYHDNNPFCVITCLVNITVF